MCSDYHLLKFVIMQIYVFLLPWCRVLISELIEINFPLTLSGYSNMLEVFKCKPDCSNLMVVRLELITCIYTLKQN